MKVKHLILILALVFLIPQTALALSDEFCSKILTSWGYLQEAATRCEFVFSDPGTEESTQMCLSKEFVFDREPQEYVVDGAVLFEIRIENEGQGAACMAMKGIVRANSKAFVSKEND